ncbi:hypothetical protein ACLMJK_003262 [Lecanora helva]
MSGPAAPSLEATSEIAAPRQVPSPTGLPMSPFPASSLPQDPFYPRSLPEGPVFLDSQACVCALRSPSDSDDVAWRCLGNSTSDIYTGDSGKWFAATNKRSTASNLPIDDTSNPPDTNNALITTPNSSSLVPLGSVNPNPLSVFDGACTGINRTRFSTSYYRAVQEIKANQTPVDAAPCWRKGAVPVQIQNVSSWQATGCFSGFFCPNNTINSLPQYCPPMKECEQSRLFGAVCIYPKDIGGDGLNFGMGPFEPVLCSSGHYCPVNASEQIPCPAGSYCPPGSEKPIQCVAGSYCPKGSQNQTILLPFGLLILVDALLIILLLFLGFWAHRSVSRRGHLSSLPKRTKTLAAFKNNKKGNAGYKSLEDEPEMVPLESTIRPLGRSPTGFQAALDAEVYLAENAAKPEMDVDSNPELRRFVDSMRKAVQVSNFGLSFDFSQLSFQPKGSTKPILSQISGHISNGSLTGIMGGSGAGKSTFVNVLMGKSTHTGGSVKVNGLAAKMKQYKKIIGYVPQDDVVLPELTVRENVLHSARIRLPSNWSDKEIQNHTDAVIDCLELSHVKDSLVGSVAKPVISGGQRKRVSIGMELGAAPMALFLDEPTSGLDATAASSIMRILKALSHLGISIIVIIHQPRIEIFELIDDLILLSNGRLIFQGKERNVKPFFQGLGFEFPNHSNAGDVVTDIITGNGRLYKKGGDVSKESLISHWEAISSNNVNKEAPASQGEAASLRRSIRKRGASWPKQIYFCLNGEKGVNFTGFYLDPYTDLSTAVNYKSVPQMALLVCIAIGLIASAPGVRVFGEEYLMYKREAASGHNIPSYYIAKVISTIPRMVFGCFHFTTFFILLATPRISWGASFVVNLMYAFCIYGLSSMVSMIARQEDGPLIAVMASLIVGVLSGAAPPLRKVDVWHVGWLWRSSPGVWLAEVYFGENVGPWGYLYDVKGASKNLGFGLDQFKKDVLVLLLIGTVYRILAYGALVISRRFR